MPIDFTLPPELEELRLRVRDFIQSVVMLGESRIGDPDEVDRGKYIQVLLEMRAQAHEAGLWLPHMPEEWGGMGLGHVELAMVQAEAAKSYYGPWVLNCQAPDEGNMHTLLHWGTDEQKEKYLRPLCEGHVMVVLRHDRAGGRRLGPHAHPDQRRTPTARSGSSTATSGSSPTPTGPSFAILIARTEDDPDIPQAANTAFLVDIPSRGLERGAPDRDDARLHRPLRDPHRGPAGARVADARRSRPGSPARPVPPRPGPPRALHALDRPGRDGARHDGRPLAQPLLPRLAARREAGHPVDDRRLGDGALPGAS